MRAFRAALLIVLFVATSVRADTLWNTYGSGYVNGFLSGPAHNNAEDFVLGGPSQITAARWTGLYGNSPVPGTDNFSVEVFGDSGGNPGANPIDTLAGTIVRTDTGTTFGASEVYNYSLSLSSPLVLGAGTYYFDPIDDVAPNTFFWAVVADTGVFWVRNSAGGAWTQSAATLAFSIDGVALAPLPSSAWGGLVLLGGLGLMMVLRRRWSTAA